MAEALDTDVYAVLRGLAARQLKRGGAHTLDTTGLVHEAWLKLREGTFESRGHYLAVAATAMRQILVDHARRRFGEAWWRCGSRRIGDLASRCER